MLFFRRHMALLRRNLGRNTLLSAIFLANERFVYVLVMLSSLTTDCFTAPTEIIATLAETASFFLSRLVGRLCPLTLGRT